MIVFSRKVVFAFIFLFIGAPSTQAAPGAKPEMVLQVGHQGQMADMAFSPDGKTLVSATRGVDGGFGEVKLWDTSNGDLKRDLTGAPADMTSVAFSPDGATLATAARGKAIQLWDARRGTLTRTFVEDKFGVVSLLFLDAQTLIKAGGGAQASGEVSLWNVADGKKRRTLSGIVKNLEAIGLDDRRVLSLSLNREVLVAATSTSARIWSTRSWKLLRSIQFPGSSSRSYAISPDGKTLIVSLEDSESMRFYDIESGKLKRSWRTPNAHAASLAISADARTLMGSMFGGGDMGLICWWRTSDGKILRMQKADEYEIEMVTLSPDGKTLASGGGMWAPGVKFWDTATGKLLYQPVAVFEDIQALAFAPEGSTLGAAQDDGTVRFWDLRSGGLKKTIDDAGDSAEVGDVNAVAFSPDGSTLAVGGGSNFTLHLWNWKTADRKPLEFKRTLPQSMAFSKDGALLAATCSDYTTRVWNVQSGTLLHTLVNSKRDQAAIHGATVFSYDGELLATSGAGLIHFWNPASGQKLFEIKQFSVERAKFSRDNKFLAADTWIDELQVHDIATRKTLWQKKDVLDFAWTPDGDFLWCRNADNTISRHDAQSGKLLQSWSTLVGNARVSDIQDDITAWLVISPDGKLLIGKSEEQSINVWQANSGRLLLTFRILPTSLGVTSQDWIAYTPEGFYTGSKDCEKWIRWRVGAELFVAKKFKTQFHRPDLVSKALQ